MRDILQIFKWAVEDQEELLAHSIATRKRSAEESVHRNEMEKQISFVLEFLYMKIEILMQKTISENKTMVSELTDALHQRLEKHDI